MESNASNQREAEARAQGEQWAQGEARANLATADGEVIGRYLAYLAETDPDTMADEPAIPTGLEGGSMPNTFREANKDRLIWGPAMDKEMRGLDKVGAWVLVPRERGMNVISSKWAYARKFDTDGTWKPKACLVAKGFHQIPGIDYFETHASVVQFDSLHLVCAIATYHDMEMGQDDIKKAYLNATPQEMVYMEQPEGYISATHPDYVCAILWSLYGLMQARNDWWKDLDTSFDELGFERSHADECVHARIDDNGLSLTATYTDDITSAADNSAGLAITRHDISSCYRLSGGGEFRYMLGVAVERDREAKTMKLTQRTYAERVLARFNMQDANPVLTPLEPGTKLLETTETVTGTDAKEMKTIPYREALGAIMYLAIATHPDLSYAVQLLSRHMSNPNMQHWKALKCVLRYIRGTLDYGIIYHGPPSPTAMLQPVLLRFIVRRLPRLHSIYSWLHRRDVRWTHILEF